MSYKYCGVQLDLNRDALLTEQGLRYLTQDGFYKLPSESTPQEVFARTANAYAFGDKEFAQRIYEYASKKWFSFASPLISNAPKFEWKEFKSSEFVKAGEWLKKNVTPSGLPISCYKNLVSDNKESLIKNSVETKLLSMSGGGIGIKMENRAPDSKSTGVMAHAKGYDADTLAYKQAESRRGSMALYLEVDHPEIMNFLAMRDPTGGDINKKCLNLNHAINITDKFMNKVLRGEKYELVDPKHGATSVKLDAREVWEKILQLRKETGEPYLLFIDTVNKNLPKWITKPTYRVRQSNLCSEITLMTSEKRTAVCCLSSLNLEKFDEWKDTQIVEDLVRLLDNVLEYFILLAPEGLNRAVHSASKERAIGLGGLGFHSYLQSKMISMESEEARKENLRIFKLIKDKAIKASLQLGNERGEVMDCMGTGMRNSHLLAIAPNASSSALVGSSPSVEPWKANVFLSEGRAGSVLIKNEYLEKYLESIGKNNKLVWDNILRNEGSIQQLEFIPKEVKGVFKTAMELNQMSLINLGVDRAPLVCQSQSINVFIHNKMSAQELSDIHFQAWAKGLKSLYYCRGDSSSKASIGTGGSMPLNAVAVEETDTSCCEG